MYLKAWTFTLHQNQLSGLGVQIARLEHRTAALESLWAVSPMSTKLSGAQEL